MASTDSTINFKRANHLENVLNILQVYIQRRQMCDIVIIAGIDGTKVPAHRLLLSVCSLYFLNKFMNEFHQHAVNEVTVACVSGSSLKALIDYCYSGEIEIRKDNVKTLMDAAYRLHMDDVYKVCQDFLADNPVSGNSREVARIGANYGVKDVQMKAEVFKQGVQMETEVFKDYMQACDTEEFSLLTIEQLCNIIASDDLVVNSEEDVFNSCVSWVNVDRVGREKYFHRLLALVRLPLLSLTFIIEHVKPHALCTSRECKELIIDALAWHLNPIKGSSLNTQPRISNMGRSSANDVLVAITINTRNIHDRLVVQSYNNTTNEWTDWKIELPNQGRTVYAMIGDSLLIVGEYEDSSNPGNVYSYSFKSKTLTEQKPLNSPRAEMGCAVLDGYVYVVGGTDSSYKNLNTVERWDPNVQSWTYMSAMAVKRQGMGIAVLGEYLYAVGGLSGSYENSMERYDPYTNEWTPMASMNVGRLCPGVAAGHGYLYAVGGRTDKATFTPTVERFDPVANKWTMISSIGSVRQEISCAFLGDSLMAVGGNDGFCWEPAVEQYDVDTNKWSVKKPLRGAEDSTKLVIIPKIYLQD